VLKINNFKVFKINTCRSVAKKGVTRSQNRRRGAMVKLGFGLALRRDPSATVDRSVFAYGRK
jgi:hypothetical protein